MRKSDCSAVLRREIAGIATVIFILLFAIMPASSVPTDAAQMIDIIKETSADGITWYDANDPPGPYIHVGDTVYWHYIVQNTGNVPLSNIIVTDDRGVTITCSKDTLEPGESMTCTSSGTAVAGQYENVGTVTGYYEGKPCSDTDTSHYFGSSPQLEIIKSAAKPGPAAAGDVITYTYTVKNTGKLPADRHERDRQPARSSHT